MHGLRYLIVQGTALKGYQELAQAVQLTAQAEEETVLARARAELAKAQGVRSVRVAAEVGHPLEPEAEAAHPNDESIAQRVRLPSATPFRHYICILGSTVPEFFKNYF